MKTDLKPDFRILVKIPGFGLLLQSLLPQRRVNTASFVYQLIIRVIFSGSWNLIIGKKKR